MFPPERGRVKAIAFSPRFLYSSSHRSNAHTRVLRDVALHVITVTKSKAAGLLYLSGMPRHAVTPTVRRGYPGVALTCGSPKISPARLLPACTHTCDAQPLAPRACAALANSLQGNCSVPRLGNGEAVSVCPGSSTQPWR